MACGLWFVVCGDDDGDGDDGAYWWFGGLVMRCGFGLSHHTDDWTGEGGLLYERKKEKEMNE